MWPSCLCKYSLCRYAACDLSTEAFRVTAPLQYCYIILSLVDEDSFQLVDLVAGRVALNSTVPYQCVEKLPVLQSGQLDGGRPYVCSQGRMVSSFIQLKKAAEQTYPLRVQELPLEYLVMYACASQLCFVADVQLGLFVVELRHEKKSEGEDLPGPVRKQAGHQHVKRCLAFSPRTLQNDQVIFDAESGQRALELASALEESGSEVSETGTRRQTPEFLLGSLPSPPVPSPVSSIATFEFSPLLLSPNSLLPGIVTFEFPPAPALAPADGRVAGGAEVRTPVCASTKTGHCTSI